MPAAANLNIDARSTQNVALDNQQIPREGGKALALPILDFSQANQFYMDAELLGQLGFMSMVQTAYIDMSTSDVPMQVTINGSQQVIVAKGRTQGYYPVMAPNPVKLTFSCPGGPGLDVTTNRIGIRVFLINVPIAGLVWATL
jgi:hypothetical protein